MVFFSWAISAPCLQQDKGTRFPLTRGVSTPGPTGRLPTAATACTLDGEENGEASGPVKTGARAPSGGTARGTGSNSPQTLVFLSFKSNSWTLSLHTWSVYWSPSPVQLSPGYQTQIKQDPDHRWPVGTPVSVLVFGLIVPHTCLCRCFLREGRGTQGA